MSVRPDFTWRDFQRVTVATAQPLNPTDEWQSVALGRSFSHKYGYGRLDTELIVEYSKKHDLVGKHTKIEHPISIVEKDVLKGDGISSIAYIDYAMVLKARMHRVESVTASVTINAGRRGQVEVELVSPRGVKSVLASRRQYDSHTSGFQNWTFMSSIYWLVDCLSNLKGL
jgi:kexin